MTRSTLLDRLILFAIAAVLASPIAAQVRRPKRLEGQSAAPQLATWNRFRGPNGSGVADATGLPLEFGPDLNVVWRVAVPVGGSSPVLARDRLFLTAVDGGELVTLAYDRASGRELWRAEAPRPRRTFTDPLAAAGPSAATDDETVVVFFPDFGVLAYGMDGTEEWRVPLDRPLDNDSGAAASPVILDRTVFLMADQRTRSFMVALDMDDEGKEKWRIRRSWAASSHSTPIFWQLPGQEPELIVAGSLFLSGYTIAGGEHRWWVRGMPYQMNAVPVLGNGMVYVNGYGTAFNDAGSVEDPGRFNEALEKYDADGNGEIARSELPDGRPRQFFDRADLDRDGTLQKNDWDFLWNSLRVTNAVFGLKPGGRGEAVPGATVWRYTESVSQLPSPLYHRLRLYSLTDQGVLTILESDTGKVLDQGQLGNGDTFHASPILGDDKIYVSGQSGKVFVLPVGDQVETMAVNDLGERVHATPAIADGRIFLRTGSTLYCFGLQ